MIAKIKSYLLGKLIATSVEIEPLADEEARERLLNDWDTWYPLKRQQALLAIAEYAERQFAEIERAKAIVEAHTGESIRIRTPKQVIRIPNDIMEQLQEG